MLTVKPFDFSKAQRKPHSGKYCVQNVHRAVTYFSLCIIPIYEQYLSLTQTIQNGYKSLTLVSSTQHTR